MGKYGVLNIFMVFSLQDVLLTSDINLLVDCDKLANICKTLATVHRLNGLQSACRVNTTGLVKSGQDFEKALGATLKTQASKSLVDLISISQQSGGLTSSPEYHFDFTDSDVDGSPSFPVSKLRKEDSHLIFSTPVIRQEYGKSDIQFTGTETKSCRTDRLGPLIHEIHNMDSFFNCKDISYGAKKMSSQTVVQKHEELAKHEASFPRKTALSVEEICKRAYDFIYEFDDTEQMNDSNFGGKIVGKGASNVMPSDAALKPNKNKGMKNDMVIGGSKQKTGIQCCMENEIPFLNLAKQYLHTKHSGDRPVPGTNEGKLLTTPTSHKKIPKEQKVSNFLSIFNETTIEHFNRDRRDVSAVHNNSKQTQSIVPDGIRNVNYNNGNNSSTPFTFYANSDNVSRPSRYVHETKTSKDFRKKFSEQFKDLKCESLNAQTHSPPEGLGQSVSNGKVKPGMKYNGTNTKPCIKRTEKQYGPANKLRSTALVNGILKSQNQSESRINENRTVSRALYKKSNIPKYVHFADIV